MSTPEPYNRDELILDVIAWRTAPTEKQAAAFVKLLDAATATALTDQNRVLIEAIREIRVGLRAS